MFALFVIAPKFWSKCALYRSHLFRIMSSSLHAALYVQSRNVPCVCARAAAAAGFPRIPKPAMVIRRKRKQTLKASVREQRRLERSTSWSQSCYGKDEVCVDEDQAALRWSKGFAPPTLRSVRIAMQHFRRSLLES